MLPLFFCETGATAPAGHNGGITMAQAFPVTNGWTATPWYGGTNLGSITLPRQADAYQRAMIVLVSEWINRRVPDQDPDN